MKRYLVYFTLVFIAVSGLWSAGKQEEPSSGIYAYIKTSKGMMVFELDYENTPLLVSNFAGLAKGLLKNSHQKIGTAYYDGMQVYRIAPKYAVFIGDPDASGEGGPGYSLPREPKGKFTAADSGVLVMDGMGTESAGSRFFITISGDDFLDTKYTSFGRIHSGKQTLQRLRKNDVVESIEIVQLGSEAKAFPLTQESFENFLHKTRMEEITRLARIDPNLSEEVRNLGEDRKKTMTGIYYTILTEGDGKYPTSGDLVSIDYIGSLADGRVFDNTQSRGQAFSFTISEESLIPGWIEMIIGMRAGETRKAIIPPEMAYGSRGFSTIKPNSWLVFEMTLLEISEN